MDDDNSILPPPKRTPWNKGKLIGAKPPLLARHVWSIRTKLQIERRARELAMFNLAIDSKLRGCDVVAMRVEDVASNGYPLAPLSKSGKFGRRAANKILCPAMVLPQVERSATASLDHPFRAAQLCDCRSAEPAFALRPCSAVGPTRRGACAVWRSWRGQP